MNFGQAVELLKQGKKVKRKTWGGYWFIHELISVGVIDVVDEQNVKTKLNYVMPNTIVAKLKDGIYVPATAYQADILAEDWEEVE